MFKNKHRKKTNCVHSVRSVQILKIKVGRRQNILDGAGHKKNTTASYLIH